MRCLYQGYRENHLPGYRHRSAVHQFQRRFRHFVSVRRHIRPVHITGAQCTDIAGHVGAGKGKCIDAAGLVNTGKHPFGDVEIYRIPPAEGAGLFNGIGINGVDQRERQLHAGSYPDYRWSVR